MADRSDTADALLKAGDVDGALAALYVTVRTKPADVPARRFLFQLLALTGKWDKALNQLQVLGEMDAASLMLREISRPLVACELLRTEVFAGRKTPLIFGEPEEWMGWMVQALALLAGGNHAAARELRERALEAAPATSGQLNGQPFEWIADADSRIGPFLEAVIDGKYFWVPFQRVASIAMETPADLRDLIWIPARLGWVNGGEAWAHVPVRYPGSEAATDGALRLARRTEWIEAPEETYTGLGQRMFSTDAGDFALLEARQITLGAAAPADGAPPPAA